MTFFFFFFLKYFYQLLCFVRKQKQPTKVSSWLLKRHIFLQTSPVLCSTCRQVKVMSHRCVVATFRFAVSMKCVQQSPMRGALLHFRPKITKNSLISPPWLAGYLCTNETIKNTSLIFSPGHHPLDEL